MYVLSRLYHWYIPTYWHADISSDIDPYNLFIHFLKPFDNLPLVVCQDSYKDSVVTWSRDSRGSDYVFRRDVVGNTGGYNKTTGFFGVFCCKLLYRV